MLHFSQKTGGNTAHPTKEPAYREGVMWMGNNRGVKALRFVVCLVIVLAVAIALAPKAC